MEGGKSFRGTRAGRRVKKKKEWKNLQNFILQLSLVCTSNQSTSASKREFRTSFQNLSSKSSAVLEDNLQSNSNEAEQELQTSSSSFDANMHSENATQSETDKNKSEKYGNSNGCSGVVGNKDEPSTSKNKSYRGVRAGKVTKRYDQVRRMSMFLQSLAITCANE